MARRRKRARNRRPRSRKRKTPKDNKQQPKQERTSYGELVMQTLREAAPDASNFSNEELERVLQAHLEAEQNPQGLWTQGLRTLLAPIIAQIPDWDARYERYLKERSEAQE